MRGVALVDAWRELERSELAGDRDVRDDIKAADPADRGDGRLRVRELLRELAVELDLHVGVLCLNDEPAEAAVLDDEVVLVAETIRLPVEQRVDRRVQRVADPVEDDVAVEPRAALEVDRDVLEAKVVAARRTQLHVERRKVLIGNAEVPLQIDRGPLDPERLAGDRHVRRRTPHAGVRLDVKQFARGGVVERPRFELRVRRRGGGEQGDGGRDGPGCDPRWGVTLHRHSVYRHIADRPFAQRRADVTLRDKSWRLSTFVDTPSRESIESARLTCRRVPRLP